MTILEIRIIPDPVLRVVGEQISSFDAALHTLLDDMYNTMVAANGIGIAAPQVGVSKRVAVVDLSVDSDEQFTPLIRSLAAPEIPADAHIHKKTRLEIINPVVIKGGKAVSSDEGCLSIPEYRDTIQRHESVTVKAVDRLGRPFEITAQGLYAFCLQHEIDHLDGVLFVDHLSRLKRQLFQKWMNKQIDRDR